MRLSHLLLVAAARTFYFRRIMASPTRVNSGVFDPTSPSAHESTPLSPESLQAELDKNCGADLPADAKVLVAEKEFGIFEYLVNVMEIDACIAAARSSPPQKWLTDSVDTSGRHPLLWACQTAGFTSADRVDLVRALLESRSDPNCRDADMFGMQFAGFVIKDLATKCGGKTPLHHLCGSLPENPHTLQAVDLLIEYGADSSLEDADGNTAGMLARIKAPKSNARSAERLGAPELSESEVEEKRKAYERLCLEREETWKKGRLEERIQARQEYLARVRKEYKPKHPSLYSLSDEDVFEPSFIEALKVGTREAFESMKDFERLSDGLYKYRIFQQKVCLQLMEEVDHFNAFAAETGLPVTRPNSMNRYGLVLNEIGFLSTMDKLMRQFIQPFATAFFSERIGSGFNFESLHAFIVRYIIGEDLDLKTHRDDSDLTLNICLGKEFEGSTLYFHSDRGSSTCSCSSNPEEVAEEFAYPHPESCRSCTFKFAHTPGVALMHTGAHVHGVERLRSGERSNLILWCRTRPYKEELQRELSTPV